MDDVKQKELALAFTNALDGTKQLSVEKIGKVTFDSSSKVNATFESKKENNYYVYGYGKLQGIYSDKNAATNAAKATYGLVTDNRGHKIWVLKRIIIKISEKVKMLIRKGCFDFFLYLYAKNF